MPNIIQFPSNRALAGRSICLLGSGSGSAKILPFPRLKFLFEGPWEYLPPTKYLGMDMGSADGDKTIVWTSSSGGPLAGKSSTMLIVDEMDLSPYPDSDG